jgi:hypothetical protein
MPDRRRPAHVPSASDWRRANIAIAVGWGALAVTFGAYAIVRKSPGALVLALVVVWFMRIAWVAAWRGEEEES